MPSVKIKSISLIEALAIATANEDVRKAIVAKARSQSTRGSRKGGGKKSHKKKSERKKPVETGTDTNNVNDNAPQNPISYKDALYEIPSPQPIQWVNGLYEKNFFTPSLDEKSSVEHPSFRQNPHELPLYEANPLSSVDLSSVKPSLVQTSPDCTEKSSIKRSPKPPPKIPLPEKPCHTSKPEPEPQPVLENEVWESRYHYLNDELEPQPSTDKEVWEHPHQTLRQQPEPQPLPANEASESRYHYLNEELQPQPSSEKEVWENPYHTPKQEPETIMYRAARCSTESDGALSCWPQLRSRLSPNRSTFPTIPPLSLPQSTFSERSQHNQIHASPSWGLRLKNHLKPLRSHLHPSSNAGDGQALDSGSTVIPALHFDDYRHLSRRECSYDPAVDALFAHIPRKPGQHFPGEIVVHSVANGFRSRIEVFPPAGPPTPQLKPISIVRRSTPLSLQSADRTPHGRSKANVSAWHGEAHSEEQLSRRTMSAEWPGLSRVVETDENHDGEEEEEDDEDEDGIEAATVGPEDSASCAGRRNRERRRLEATGMPPVPPRTRDWVLDNDYPAMI